MGISADGLDVIGIGTFLARHFLAVPSNQRSYAWLEDNVTDFWLDILRAAGAEKRDDYFVGSIVLSRREDDQILEVVDGQQRLATTMIVYGAIRDWYMKMDRAEEAATLMKYLSETDEDTGEDTPRLALNTEDHDFFNLHVIKPANKGHRTNPIAENKKNKYKPSHVKIAAAAEMIRIRVHALVKDLPIDHAIARLKQITKFIREKVKLILVIVDSHDSAYTVFETLNDRGLDLSKADLLKNHIYRTAGTKKIKAAEAKWQAMSAALETVTRREITVDYIRYLWISEKGHVREKHLYKFLKEEVREPAQAVFWAEKLAESAVHYASILNSDHENWGEYGEDSRHNLSIINLIGIERIRPLTLAVVRHFAKNEIIKALQYLICASVRILIAGPPAGTLEQDIAKVAPLISPSGIRTAKDLSAEMLSKDVVPADAKFRAGFATAMVSDSVLARYYLRALEQAATPDTEKPWLVRREQSKSSVEHVLPQKPSPFWSIPEDEAKALRTRLGNLALLAAKPNADVGGGDFVKIKAPVYKDCPLILTSEIGEYKFNKQRLWRKQEIDARQERLADLALAAWPAKWAK
ncbi:DUF262 domain-containing protein [Anatilimnocola floriformis]|uniref:DUF262 domain-containing protein n=1 Tax=Anatilimnocola floriformis TaxID=2948575 RepID=UPI0020C4B8F6|nr:DUF262 domain-containing protein [Anatilimnocola floriformis]